MLKRLLPTALVVFSSLPALAQSELPVSSSELTIAAPPLGNPSYEGALFDRRQTPTPGGRSSIELGAGLAFGSSDEVSATGLGAFLARRWAFGAVGVRIPLTLGVGFGDAFGADLSALAFSLGANLDVNLLAFDGGSLQAFAGYQVAGSRAGLSRQSFSGDVEATVYTLLHGPQLGIQAAIELGQHLVVTPFYALRSLSGRVDRDVQGAGFDGFLDTLDLPRFTASQLGLDVTYVPWGLSLSGIQDLQPDDPSVEAVDTFSLVLTFRFFDGEDARPSADDESY